MTVDTNELIVKLVNEGAKKPLPHPAKQALLWQAGAALYLAAFLGYSGFRADIQAKLTDPVYIFELFILFCVAFVAALAAFCLSRPDEHQRSWVKFSPLPLLVLWAVTAFVGTALTKQNIVQALVSCRFDCVAHIALFSLPIGILMFLAVHRGAIIRCCWAGAMVALSVTTSGYLLMRLIEMNDDPLHLIFWHALPIMLMCFMGMVIGKYALRWKL